MIVVMDNGDLRDKQTATMTFVHRSTDGLHHKELNLSHPSKLLAGLVRPIFDMGQGVPTMHLHPQQFTIESIDTLLITEFPEKFVSTTLRLHLGEKDVFHSGILGEFVAPQKTYFRHHEYKHTVDGQCICPHINQLQCFFFMLHHVPDAPFTIQVVVAGKVFNPVP